MNRLLFIFALVLVTLSLSAQNQTNKMSIGIAAGGNGGLSPLAGESSPAIYKPAVFQGIGKLMLTNQFGVMGRAQYNNIKLNSSSIQTNYVKTGLHALYDVAPWFGSKGKFRLYTHTGIGFAAQWQADAFDDADSPVFNKADEMLIWDIGISPELKLSDRWSILLDYTFTSHMLQDRPYTMGELQQIPYTDGNMMTLTAGIAFHFGKTATTKDDVITDNAEGGIKKDQTQEETDSKSEDADADRPDETDANTTQVNETTNSTSENDVTRNVKPEKQQTVTESQSREKDSKEQASDYTDFAKGDIREFDNLLFTYQKARLTKTSRETLNQLADYMQTHTGLKLKIKGYTDCIGDEDENLALSRKRAENTANYLKAKGIAANRLGIKAYGEQQLIRPCQDSPLYYMTGNLKNRRVELELLPNN